LPFALRQNAVLASLLLAGCTVAAAEPVDFERQIAVTLARHCAECHNDSDPAGGLNLTQHDAALKGGESGQPAIVPGKSTESYLIERVAAGEMPPEGKGARVGAAELKQLEAWIDAGAPWPNGRVLSALETTSQNRAGRDWWSLKAVQRPPLPAVRNARWVRTPIDAFVLAALEAAGLEPSAEADRATFIRRASFDLLGLPPTQAEIVAFVADRAPDAYERLVDRMLASPRYGERWARHWLDVVRFGESNGYETNTARPNAWPYRDWLIGALNDDLPYDRFVLAQLAGDQVGQDAATGYLVAGAHDIVGSPDVELTLAQRMNDLDDMIATTGSAFLGLSVACARCHDHKFDPISQRDYYALQAVFAGVQHGERELHTAGTQSRDRERSELQAQRAKVQRQLQSLLARQQPLARVANPTSSALRPPLTARLNVDRFAPVRARFVRFTVLATSQLEPCLDELEVFAAGEEFTNLAAATTGAKATASSVFAGGTSNLHQLSHINDGRYGNSRSWISAETGGGWVQIELGEPALIECVIWGRDRDGAFKDRLPTRYKIEASEDGAAWQTMATSDDRGPYDPQATPPDTAKSESVPTDVAQKLEALRGEVAALSERIERLAPQQIYAGTFVEPPPMHLLYRGEAMQKRKPVAPGAVSAVGSPLALAESTNDAERRLALARWIADEKNPLSARVMVNRIWHYHFGQGLVRTPSDFGFNGGQASHPALLDWMATEFIASGGRAKPLHRKLMLSSTYRQASTARAAPLATDATNRLLWRFSPRRLEAEAIRDAVLATSGALDLRMGGPGYDVFEPNTNYVKVYVPKKAFGADDWRRMVYQNKPRMRQDATFGEFDCPDSSQTMARRNVSTTALQALNLLNGPFMVEQAGLFAERLKRDAGDDQQMQIRSAFWLALGREPDEDELSAAQALVAREGLLAFCRALYNANEFLHLN
jgi:mono/diheme cytochrome c family protein